MTAPTHNSDTESCEKDNDREDDMENKMNHEWRITVLIFFRSPTPTDKPRPNFFAEHILPGDPG